MNELPAAFLLVALLGAGVAATLATPRGWRAALLLSERPLTWLSPILLAWFVQFLLERLIIWLHLLPDLTGYGALRVTLVTGALSLAHSVPTLAILAGQLGMVRRVLDGAEPTPGDFWNGMRANFAPLLVVRVLFALVGMMLQTFPILVPPQYGYLGWLAAGLVILCANVEVYPIAVLLGAGPGTPADLFHRSDALSRREKWRHALPVALQLLGVGMLTIFPNMTSDAEGTRVETLAIGFHSICVFDYGLEANWFSDLTRNIATYNPGRLLMLYALGTVVGMFSVFMIAVHMQTPLPQLDTPAAPTVLPPPIQEKQASAAIAPPGEDAISPSTPATPPGPRAADPVPAAAPTTAAPPAAQAALAATPLPAAAPAPTAAAPVPTTPTPARTATSTPAATAPAQNKKRRHKRRKHR